MDRQQRPYQSGALEAALTDLAAGLTVLLVLATGLGKTVIFSLLAKHFAPSGRILVLAPTRKLVAQAAKEVARWGELRTGIEMGKARCDPANLPQVVVASVMSLANPERLRRFSPTDFTLIVIDEAHHVIATTYRRILDHFRGAKVVGLTATPERGDKQSLGQVFTSAPYRFDMEAAIRGGWLVPIRQMRVVVTSIDYSRVRATRKDLNEKDLERVLIEERHLQAMAGAMLKHAGARRTLVFAASVDHAHRLAGVLNRFRDGCARAVDGSTKGKQLEEALEALRLGKVQFIVNCALLREGFNEPTIECIAFCCPTRRRHTFVQMLGRGLRLCPEIGKRDLLVLDFVGVAGKHKLVSALEALAGDLEPRVRELAERAADQGADLLEAIDASRAEVARELARQRELEEQQRRGIVAEVASHLIEVPTGLEVARRAAIQVAPVVRPLPTPPQGGVTADQVLALRRYGVPGNEIARMDAVAAATHLVMRTASSLGGTASPSHARILLALGIDPRTLSARGAAKVVAGVSPAELARIERRLAGASARPGRVAPRRRSAARATSRKSSHSRGGR